MDLIKVRGIILKTIDFKEKDKLIYIATPDKGKITVIAKNSRGKKSKTMSVTQPINLCDFVLFNGKNIHTLNEISIVHSFPKLKDDFEYITYASYFLELCDIAMEDGEENPRMFLELVKGLYVLETKVVDIELLLRAFEIKILLRSGNQPSPIINGVPIPDGPRSIIRFMLNKELDKLLELDYKVEDLKRVEEINKNLLKECFQRRPKSLDVLNYDLFN